MSFAYHFGWSLYYMDVTTFLNGNIKEEVYINHPRGFKVHGCDIQKGCIWAETSTLCPVLLNR